MVRICSLVLLLLVAGCVSSGPQSSGGVGWPRSGGAIEVRDRLEVLDLYARYALYADAPAGEAYASLFTEDGGIQMGEQRILGRAALAARIGGKTQRTLHLQGHPVLVQLAPDRMVARTEVILATRAAAGAGQDSPPSFTLAVYQDELARTPTGWRFVRRSAGPSAELSPEFLPAPASTAAAPLR